LVKTVAADSVAAAAVGEADLPAIGAGKKPTAIVT